MLTFEQYQEQSIPLDAAIKTTSIALKELTEGNQGSMGLVSKEVFNSAAYRAALTAYNVAFQAVRQFNQATPNEYKRRNRKYK